MIGRRVRALPGLVAEAPRFVLVLVGLVVTLLGINLLTRPLSALEVLGSYIGVSCVLSGLGDLMGRREGDRDSVVVRAIGWLAAGVAIVAWIGRSIELMGPFVAVLLIGSGCTSLVTLLRAHSSVGVLRGCSPCRRSRGG